MEIRLSWDQFCKIPADEIILMLNVRMRFVDSSRPELGYRAI